mmetsp:Transcript_17910/g.32259  ORF Transcript_17910/g.32259 Transcript_17910/m.32259 type:complete len:195 (+) Transcript_17910:93-677(+)
MKKDMQGVDNPFIDWHLAECQLGGSKLHKAFIERFEEETLKLSLRCIQTGIRSRDWGALQREARNLDGGAGYIGANICRRLAECLYCAAAEIPVDEQKVYLAYNNLAAHAKQLQEYLSHHLKKEFTDSKGVFSFRAGDSIEEQLTEHTLDLSKEGDDDEVVYVIRRVNSPFTKVYFNEEEDELEMDELPELNTE